MGNSSMFLPRPFSYEWHERHCLERFPGMKVDPFRMNNEWKFDDLLWTNTSRIVFANGLRDGWSTSSITSVANNNNDDGGESRQQQIRVLNFPNGAHHSELKGGPYPNPKDTDDILQGYDDATDILSTWLDEIYA